ncbi:MAG: metallopeptidase family protein [Verrucomicrobia bacterium]|nr:metallopeptidase family protein [Verrucomicrobiota bacterium]
MTDTDSSQRWDHLVRLAQQQVRETWYALPAPLRDKALRLPVIFEPFPGPEHAEQGIEPDSLGLFSGPAFGEEYSTDSVLCPQITLFLENLWEFAEENPEVFLEEVRVTLLHELGHYLGLDEEDLMDRGLE